MTALVLLPGLDGTGKLFSDFTAALPTEYRVINAAYPVDIPMGYNELEPLVQKLLPQDEPYFLLAESFSGPLAVKIAAASPPGLLGLILCCTFIKNPHPVCYPLHPLTHIFPFTWMPFSLLKCTHLDSSAPPALIERISAIVERHNNKVIQKRIYNVLKTDTSPLLSKLTLPILYLRAKRDWVILKSSSEHILRLAPHTQLVEFDAPHFLLQSQPKETAMAVANFIESIP